MHSLQDAGILATLDELGPVDQAWADGFYPAFLANSRVGASPGRAVPAQHGDHVLQQGRLRRCRPRPGGFPKTWAELQAASVKLVRKEGEPGHALGREARVRRRQRAVDVRRTREPGRAEADERGRHRNVFQRPESDRGDELLARLARPAGRRRRARPRGRRSAPTSSRATPRSSSTPPATSPTSATRRNSRSASPGCRARTARAPWSAAATSTSSSTPARPEREAALRFARFLTEPERAADWSIRTGYIATRPEAYETPSMREYVAEIPGRRGREGLPAGRHRRAEHVREPADLQAAGRQHPGGAVRQQNAGARPWRTRKRRRTAS